MLLDPNQYDEKEMLKTAIFYFYVQKLEEPYKKFQKTVAYEKLKKRLLHFEDITKKAYEL